MHALTKVYVQRRPAPHDQGVHSWINKEEEDAVHSGFQVESVFASKKKMPSHINAVALECIGFLNDKHTLKIHSLTKVAS